MQCFMNEEVTLYEREGIIGWDKNTFVIIKWYEIRNKNKTIETSPVISDPWYKEKKKGFILLSNNYDVLG